MMQELWLCCQCDFILVFMFRQLKTGIANCKAFRQGLKNRLIFVGGPMCSGNLVYSISSRAKESLLFLTNAFKGVQENYSQKNIRLSFNISPVLP